MNDSHALDGRHIPPPPLRVVLVQPEIPPNTGNVMRLCAATGVELHLVGPLGFRLDDAALRRAGMDYREWAEVRRHVDWAAFQAALPPGARLFPLSVQGGRGYHTVAFQPGDWLLFGSEGGGLPAAILQDHLPLRLPMTPRARSLNLANCVAIVVYEALRQLGFPHLG